MGAREGAMITDEIKIIQHHIKGKGNNAKHSFRIDKVSQGSQRRLKRHRKEILRC